MYCQLRLFSSAAISKASRIQPGGVALLGFPEPLGDDGGQHPDGVFVEGEDVGTLAGPCRGLAGARAVVRWRSVVPNPRQSAASGVVVERENRIVRPAAVNQEDAAAHRLAQAAPDFLRRAAAIAGFRLRVQPAQQGRVGQELGQRDGPRRLPLVMQQVEAAQRDLQLGQVADFLQQRAEERVGRRRVKRVAGKAVEVHNQLALT